MLACLGAHCHNVGFEVQDELATDAFQGLPETQLTGFAGSTQTAVDSQTHVGASAVLSCQCHSACCFLSNRAFPTIQQVNLGMVVQRV